MIILKGNNKLVFNQATIMQIIEKYINDNFNPKPSNIKVTAFSYSNNDYYFTIETQEVKEE